MFTNVHPKAGYVLIASGILAAIYLRIYWGAFYVNPFPVLTPFQLIGYSVNAILGILVFNSFIFMYNFVKGYERAYYDHKLDQAEGSTPSNQENSSNERKLYRKPFPKPHWVIISGACYIYLTVVLYHALTMRGPIDSMWTSYRFTFPALAVVIVFLNFLLPAMPELENKSLIYFSILLVGFTGIGAIENASSVWEGGSEVTVVLSVAPSGQYGYIGELGNRTYLLEASKKSGNEIKRILSVETSKISLIGSQGKKRTSFRFGP